MDVEEGDRGVADRDPRSGGEGHAAAARHLAGAKGARDLTPADLEGIDLLRDVGFPGEAPFTRGVANIPRAATGRCASTPASAARRRPTSATTTCS